MKKDIQPSFVNIPHFAKLTDFSQSRVRKAIKMGELPYREILGSRRVPIEVVKNIKEGKDLWHGLEELRHSINLSDEVIETIGISNGQKNETASSLPNMQALAQKIKQKRNGS